MGSTDPTSTTVPPTATQRTQIMLLTIILALLFVAVMVVAGYEWLGQGKAIAQAPFESGWGLVLVTMGALLRELTARGL